MVQVTLSFNKQTLVWRAVFSLSNGWMDALVCACVPAYTYVWYEIERNAPPHTHTHSHNKEEEQDNEF